MTPFLWAAYIGLIAAGLFLRRSRAYVACCVGFAGMIAFLNTDSADYLNYAAIYSNPSLFPSIEPGWRVLCGIGSAVGLAYNGFAAVMAAAGMALLAAFARRSSLNPALFFALFLIYPFLMCLVQFRQFIAMSIAAFATLYLMREDARGRALFAALVLVAMSVHRTAMVMFALLLFPLFRRLDLRGRTAMAVAALAAYAVLLWNAETIAQFLFGSYRVSEYLYGESHTGASLLGGIRNVVLLGGMFLASLGCRSLVVSNVEQGFPGEALHGLAELSFFMQALMLALAPFMFISIDFLRFERYAFLIALPVFASMSELPIRHVALSTKALWGGVAALFAYELVIKGTFETVYLPLLSFEAVPMFFLL